MWTTILVYDIPSCFEKRLFPLSIVFDSENCCIFANNKRSKQKMIPRAKIVYIFLSTLCCATLLAIPAKRGQWKTITLSDGHQVKVELRGDERTHWWEDSVGNRYLSRGVRSEECGVRNDTETRGVWSEECGVRNDDEIWEKMEDSDWRKGNNPRRYSHSSLHTPHSTLHIPHSTKTLLKLI